MIRASNLSKYYSGKRALGPVSFEIAEGQTVGFLGLNGAGKTTALRILAGDLRPSAGKIEISGIDAVSRPHEIRKLIGFLPEHPPVYADMVVADYIKFAAALHGLRGDAFKKRLNEVLDVTNLGEVADDVIGTLSHGFRQRVGLAQAIVHRPRFLILDEPTRGLDPVQIVEMRNLIHDLKQTHTVLISSHILTEISQTCDNLLVLDRGTIVGSGSEADLSSKKDAVRQVTVGLLPSETARAPELLVALRAAVSGVDGLTQVGEAYEQAGAVVFPLSCTRDIRAEVSRAVVGAGLDLIKLDYSRSELESTFIRLVGGGNAGN